MYVVPCDFPLATGCGATPASDAIRFASKRPNSGSSIARSSAVSFPTPDMLSVMAASERVVSSFATASAINDSIRYTSRSTAWT
jgi:hypothetical protein